MKPAVRNRIQVAAIVVLALVIVLMAYKFVVAGSTVKGEDGRTAIVLTPPERALMLREMRGFVAALQQITDALSRNDMHAVASAARSVGFAEARGVPAEMLGKLPLDFKTLAFGTHREFDTIAADAEASGTPGHTLVQLSDTLKKCVACHESYQVTSAVARQHRR